MTSNSWKKFVEVDDQFPPGQDDHASSGFF